MIFVLGLTLWWWGRKAAYAVLGSIVLGAGFKQLLTVTFSVERPVGQDTRIVVYEEIKVSSFPSGHVFQVGVPWGLLYLRNLVPLIVPLGLTALVGLGRLYLGLHYVGDVVFGVLFAALFLLAFHRLWRRLQPWLAARPIGFYAGVGLVLIAGLLVNIAFTHAGGNPRRWEILGMAVGGTIGLLAEYRYLHYVPQMTRWPQRLAMSVLGLIGIAVCFALDRLVGKEVLWIGLVSGSLAMLWAVLGAPFLFTRLGWGRTKEPPLVAHRSEAGRSER